MKKQPIYIDVPFVSKAVTEHREARDVLLFKEGNGHTLSLEVNHYGGLHVIQDGIEVFHHIGVEKAADSYMNIHKELFDGK